MRMVKIAASFFLASLMASHMEGDGRVLIRSHMIEASGSSEA
jgi:hypothetical protein